MISKTTDNRRPISNEVTISQYSKPQSRDSISGQFRIGLGESKSKPKKVIHNGKLILNQIAHQQQQSRMQSHNYRKNTNTPNSFAHPNDYDPRKQREPRPVI